MRPKKPTQIDGKNDNFRPSTLDQVWGDTGLNKYKTLDENTYLTSLNEMNKSDLQMHAIKIGIVPNDSKEQTIKKLLKEFRLFVSSYKYPKINKNVKGVSDNALKILSEGR